MHDGAHIPIDQEAKSRAGRRTVGPSGDRRRCDGIRSVSLSLAPRAWSSPARWVDACEGQTSATCGSSPLRTPACLEILADAEPVARIGGSLAALGRGEPGADLETVCQDLARSRPAGR